MRLLRPPRRSGWFLALAGLLLLPSAPARSQSSGAAARFRATGLTDEITPAVKPFVLRGPTVRVVLKMASDPVAVVRARSAGKRISEAQHRAIAQAARAEQDAVAPQVTARGGRVLARYHDAFNGIKVEVAASQVAALRALPGVVDVLPVRVFQRDNAVSVPFIGAPAAWGGAPGFRGERVKVAVIDTGIDFTHANFGGPGTVAAFDQAFAADTAPADPALFGPDAPKVKGGTDLVGDDYDASAELPNGDPDVAKRTPHPDPNPLDCNGHGSHVAGTAAGFGVAADGTTFRGPWDATTPSRSFRIGPGVAPLADLYAVRVFGCEGSTDVVTDAIDWAVHNDIDVINMSLGSPFGTGDTSDAQAVDNAARAGIVVVASAGNSGHSPYITGSPASSNSAVSVAAVDSTAQFAGATLALSPSGKTITAIDANGASVPAGTLDVVVLRDPATGGVSLGCSEAEYDPAVITGKLVVTLRGVCARVDRATFGARHGAAAVVMINNGPGLPPFEGHIPNVEIPFLGVLQSDGPAIAGSTSAALAPTSIANPTFRLVADFSSGGPRYGDSALRPTVAAPGVSIFSTAVGTGNEAAALSGTSMASPHVAGVAALTLQAHPGWSPAEIRAAIENTADPAQVATYDTRLAGVGLVQPALSTRTQAVALGDTSNEDGDRLPGLSFGFEELRNDFRGRGTILVRNHGTQTITFNVAAVASPGSPHSVSVGATTVRVRPGRSEEVDVALTVPVSTVGDSSDFRQVAGLVTFTPAAPSQNGGVALRVPYYLVPRARANVETVVRGALSPRRPTATAVVSNRGARVPGTADFYAWGLFSLPQRPANRAVDLRAVGVQSFDFATPTIPPTKLLVFAVSTYGRWSNASVNEYDVLLDVNGDGAPDFAVAAVDVGAVTAGAFDGRVGSLVVNLATGASRLRFLATAPTDGTTLLLPALASDMGLTKANPRFSYQAQAFDGFTGDGVAMAGTGKFNAFTGAVTNGQFAAVDPGTTQTVDLAVNPAEFALTPALGYMIVGQENRNGGEQAQLLPILP